VIERFKLEPAGDAPASTGILGDWYASAPANALCCR
jgi:hypothetical protein